MKYKANIELPVWFAVEFEADENLPLNEITKLAYEKARASYQSVPSILTGTPLIDSGRSVECQIKVTKETNIKQNEFYRSGY